MKFGIIQKITLILALIKDIKIDIIITFFLTFY